MVKKVFTSNRAVAEAVKLAKPQVIPVYPITPQTTISEYLAQFVADGDLKSEYIRVESEHSALVNQELPELEFVTQLPGVWH